jgi:hypothetical protein
MDQVEGTLECDYPNLMLLQPTQDAASALALAVQKPFKSEAPLLLEVFNAVFQDLQPEALLAAKQVHTQKLHTRWRFASTSSWLAAFGHQLGCV